MPQAHQMRVDAKSKVNRKFDNYCEYWSVTTIMLSFVIPINNGDVLDLIHFNFFPGNYDK